MIYRFAWAVVKIFLKIFAGYKILGKEHQVPNGPVVVVANHVSNWDPLVLGTALNRKVHFMAKEELFKNFLLRWLLRQLGAFPVKRGKTAKGAIQASLKVLKQGDMLGMFPEGTRSKDGKMLKPNLGAVMLALKTEAPILPITLVGTKEFKSVKAIIGEPISLQEYYGQKLDKEKLEEISMKIMGQIKNNSRTA